MGRYKLLCQQAEHVDHTLGIVGCGFEVGHFLQLRMGIGHSHAEMTGFHHSVIIQIVSEADTLFRIDGVLILKEAEGGAYDK